MKRWFIPAAARARGQSNDLNREILASNLFNCHKEVINAPPVPSISRCIHIVYRHKNVWEYQWSNFIYNCMSTFLHYVRCKDALLNCSAPGGERCESLTWVDEILFYPDSVLLTHYPLVSDRDIGQHGSGNGLVPWHQAITWINVDLRLLISIPVQFHRKWKEMQITNIIQEITFWKMFMCLPRDYVLISNYILYFIHNCSDIEDLSHTN